ncbi:hypothetical protein FACS1894172_21750 [Spirochaetia bacterium]|nr:hypothetical protein FACS1894164_12450 [Spirochaetia bacterium]GHU38258.1 hypothetical protein FACS1894172_21750 [Spirochaetia bacterium]
MRYIRIRLFRVLFCAALGGILTGILCAEDIQPEDVIGLTVGELIARWGVPRTVYAVRGIEEWQDDVVFAYDSGDCYLYRDRVWQVATKAARSFKVGDERKTVIEALGEKVQVFERCVLVPVSGYAWPLGFRVDFDASDRVCAIFIYRPDF